ncbi:MAG: chemotaxis protein CheA [Shimia sp.]
MAADGSGPGAPRRDPMAEIEASFYLECEEHIEAMQDALGRLAEGTADDDIVDALFRAAHSIKGGAAAFDLADLVDLSHDMEDRLGAMRGSGTAIEADALDRLLQDTDRLSALVARRGATPEARSGGETLRLADLGGTGDADLLAALGTLGPTAIRLDARSVPRLDRGDDPFAPALVFHLAPPPADPTPEEAAARASLVPAFEGATAAAPASSAPLQTPTPTIRVDLDRIDTLMNLVGELVITQAMLAQSAGALGLGASSEMTGRLDDFLRLTRALQDGVMQIRAQPIKPLFHRMARIAREAAAATGKRVRFETSGQATEVDKTVIERLAEPLTHMVRNAIDHGLEADRAARGKPAEGLLRLTARHRSGQVVLQLSDDGAGLDRATILARARARGLLRPDETPTGAEIDALLFRPGFTTRDTVSDLSGRGVGLDVVRTTIQQLGGRVAIDGQPGAGTTLTISLPLTLAVLDAMIVRAGGATFVLPLAGIQETMLVDGASLMTLGTGRVLRHQGRAIPVLDMALALGSAPPGPLDGRIALTIDPDAEDPAARPFALVVDDIVEQRQVVVKGLQDAVGCATAVMGATILGDGAVALIIDPYELAPGARIDEDPR